MFLRLSRSQAIRRIDSEMGVLTPGPGVTQNTPGPICGPVGVRSMWFGGRSGVLIKRTGVWGTGLQDLTDVFAVQSQFCSQIRHTGVMSNLRKLNSAYSQS